ncbi:MAG: TetR/AcrR family transcriptional regulator [Candidatus Lokiarchaeota archaeon]|nr:TetR/AcrR family transcriptional regulator [Candidatus Lokiarchaeota archaeon]
MSAKNAKKKIILTTIAMIQEKGYGNVTTNHIAKNAKVSIGTLYYHFPDGKPSILMAIVEEKFEWLIKRSPKINIDIRNLDDLKSSVEYKKFLFNVIEQHRKGRALLAAMEAEYLMNEKLVQKLIDTFGEEPNIFLDLFKHIFKGKTEEIEGFNTKIMKIINILEALIHRHTFFPQKFGSDEEIVEILIDITTTLIKRYFS